MITSDDVANFDACARHALYSLYAPPRIPLSFALNQSLRIGLLSGDPKLAKNHLMELAAEPGLALSVPSVYDCALHHAHLIEIITTYLLAGEGAWIPSPIIDIKGHQFQPLSYTRPTALRRIVLCSRWDLAREMEERNSWRSLADQSALGLPMLINAISIGSTINGGFRPSVWTRGFSHPVSRDLRIQSKAVKGGFNENWRKVYRESSGHSPEEWLKLMQTDGAFEGVVNSVSIDLPPKHIHSEFVSLLDGFSSNSTTPRRSNCYRLTPCIHVGLCADNLTPADAGWQPKESPPR